MFSIGIILFCDTSVQNMGNNHFIFISFTMVAWCHKWAEPPIGHYPHNKGYGATIGPILGREDPGGPHVGPMNFVIWVMNAGIQDLKDWAIVTQNSNVNGWTEYMALFSIYLYLNIHVYLHRYIRCVTWV